MVRQHTGLVRGQPSDGGSRTTWRDRSASRRRVQQRPSSRCDRKRLPLPHSPHRQPSLDPGLLPILRHLRLRLRHLGRHLAAGGIRHLVRGRQPQAHPRVLHAGLRLLAGAASPDDPHVAAPGANSTPLRRPALPVARPTHLTDALRARTLLRTIGGMS